MRVFSADDTITIPLTRAEALVIVDWLNFFAQQGNVPIHDQAELVVLWRIQAHLEHVLVELNDPDYLRIVTKARHEVAGQET